MQPLSAGNNGAFSVQPLSSLCLCGLVVLRRDNHREPRGGTEKKRNLPMIKQKKTSEFIETSLIYLLSTAVAVGAFVLVWLVALLLGSSPT